MPQQYDPIRPASVAALAGYILRRVTQGYHPIDREVEEAELRSLLDTCVPHGPITEAHIEHDAQGQTLVKFKIKGIQSRLQGSGKRFTQPGCVVLLLLITAFGGHVHLVDTVSQARAEQYGYTEGRHYGYVLGGKGTLLKSSAGITVARLLVNAGPGEDVGRGEDYHDWTVEAQPVYPSPNPARSQQGREDAIKDALRLRAAKGQGAILPAYLYEALLRATFELVDACHKDKVVRLDKPPAGTQHGVMTRREISRQTSATNP